MKKLAILLVVIGCGLATSTADAGVFIGIGGPVYRPYYPPVIVGPPVVGPPVVGPPIIAPRVYVRPAPIYYGRPYGRFYGPPRHHRYW